MKKKVNCIKDYSQIITKSIFKNIRIITCYDNINLYNEKYYS